ncbi:uncharacterized protein LOC131244044 [Magnolia sinica]|uniref:uncharacterized protein LOC131244044 n=1 Tax=Magnolia sinica TaxID=86752 RepID=UPI00265A0364|nr:uncharacterized protein LOC131244044 [Magnolia sinica]
MNVDGSSRGNSSLAGGEGICRGDKGQFICACSSGYGIGSNSYAELRAVYEGLLLVLSLGFHHIILESDSLQVVKMLNGISQVSWKWKFWLGRILLLKSRGRIEFAHIFREGNTPADAFACLGSESQSSASLDRLCDLPPRIHCLLFLDKAGLGLIRNLARQWFRFLRFVWHLQLCIFFSHDRSP